MAGLNTIISGVHQLFQSVAHDWKPPAKDHLTDNSIARQYEARTQGITLLKAGKVAEFNTAQTSARTEDSDYRLNLSIDDICQTAALHGGTL